MLNITRESHVIIFQKKIMLNITCESNCESHVMSSIISSEKYEKHDLRMLSASCDWCLKG